MNCPFIIRQCTECGKLLVANTINFKKDKKGKYGLSSKCKVCLSNKCKQWREGNKEKVKQYREDNKEKINEDICKWREEHREEMLEGMKKYSKEHRKENNESQRLYRKNHPETIINNHVKRRLKEKQQGNGITKDQWYEMMRFFDWKCAYSGEYIGGNSEYRTIDHIISLNKNGEHEIWNCVPMYKSYNSSKQDKNMIEWYREQEFYSEERLNKIYKWMEYAKNRWSHK